jgi:hypothetical protein
MTRFYKLLLIIMPFSMLVAGSGFGGYRLMHVKEARTFQQGRLEIFTDMNFYTAKREAIGNQALQQICGLIRAIWHLPTDSGVISNSAQI